MGSNGSSSAVRVVSPHPRGGAANFADSLGGATVEELRGESTNDSPADVQYLAHARAVHHQKTKSLLSRRRFQWSSSATTETMAERSQLEFKGFKHLLIMVLFVGNLRIFWVDLQQFGFLNVLKQLGVVSGDLEKAVLIMASNMLYLPVALFIERATAYFARSWKEQRLYAIKKDANRPEISPRTAFKEKWNIIAVLHIINASTCLYFSSYLCYHYVWHPVIGTLVEASTIVTFLKLSSYALTNRDLRDSYLGDRPVPDLYKTHSYPHNLTLANFIYFWCAPTLVYQPVYPRTQSIRWSVVISFMAELLIGLMFIWLLSLQMAAPILEHTLADFQRQDTGKLLDDFLSLVSVNICIWLIGFFVIFQSLLNLLAELTRFADREFYGAWWNAGSIGTYWRDWNKPMSNYFRRHIYVPLRKRGWSGFTASTVVFLCSAILHELLVGTPTRNFNGVAFLCMMAQVPLISVTAPLEKLRGPGNTVGNCVFWLSIFLGQPTGVIIYYLAWNLRYG